MLNLILFYQKDTLKYEDINIFKKIHRILNSIPLFHQGASINWRDFFLENNFTIHQTDVEVNIIYPDKENPLKQTTFSNLMQMCMHTKESVFCRAAWQISEYPPRGYYVMHLLRCLLGDYS